MFGKPSYNYNNYTTNYSGGSPVSMHDINQELNQSMLNSVYSQMNPSNNNNEPTYSPKTLNSNNAPGMLPGNNQTDSNGNLAFSHAIGT